METKTNHLKLSDRGRMTRTFERQVAEIHIRIAGSTVIRRRSPQHRGHSIDPPSVRGDTAQVRFAQQRRDEALARQIIDHASGKSKIISNYKTSSCRCVYEKQKKGFKFDFFLCLPKRHIRDWELE